MSNDAIKEVPNLFSKTECKRLLAKRISSSTKDGRLTDFLVYRDQAQGEWIEEFDLLTSRLMPVIKEYSKSFFNLLPIESISISHIGFLNDEFGEFTEIHYDWELVQVKGRKLLPKPFVFLIYLTDVEEGGELLFPKHSIKIKPELGKVVLFPCNFSYPHVAMPVTKGSKHICRVTMQIDPDVYKVDALEI